MSEWFCPVPALLSIALLGIAGCGGSVDGAATQSADDPLSIEQALAETARTTLAVRGFVVAVEGEPVRLCSALAESYPPQCGEPSLVVEGLDLATVEGLVEPNDPQYAHTAWTESELSVRGALADGVLAVGG